MRETYDYVVVGGGTAGAILAARLSEDPDVTVALLEWGPSDEGEGRALEIHRWVEMLGSEFDPGYVSAPQERGNSQVPIARAAILGGCSSHNNGIAWRPLPSDLDDWVALGAEGWDHATFGSYWERLATKIAQPAAADRAAVLDAALDAAATALGVPRRERWPAGQFAGGAGYLDITYDPATGVRESSSVAYLHGVARENLEVLLETRALRVALDGGRATAVQARRVDGTVVEVSARREIVLACGAVDTPRLLLLSGVGPREQLAAVGVEPLVDLAGVGRNLQDHADVQLVWALNRAAPAEHWPPLDSASFLAPVVPGGSAPEVLAHLYRFGFSEQVEALGYVTPEHPFCISPNVARPHSRGSVELTSPDPDALPRIDGRYYTDPDGYDERTLLAGVRMARQVAATAPLADWIEREVFPGPDVQDDAELSALLRATHGSVHHLVGTCRIGWADDPEAVVDARLRVHGVEGLRIADASVMPTLTAVNPAATVMMVAERAADLLRADRA